MLTDEDAVCVLPPFMREVKKQALTDRWLRTGIQQVLPHPPFASIVPYYKVFRQNMDARKVSEIQIQNHDVLNMKIISIGAEWVFIVEHYRSLATEIE